MASRRPSPLVGQTSTWHHVSTPTVVNSTPKVKGFSPIPHSGESLIPPGDSSWSGDWKHLFADTNSSDWHGQSAASTASWSDELENESTQRLNEQYKLLEEALYGGDPAENKLQLSNPVLALECKQWRERFPHIRAVGVGITSSKDCLQNDSGIDGEGREEEVIAVHGNHEEIYKLIVNDNNTDQVKSILPTELEISEKDIENYRENVKKTVLNQIFSKIWPNIIKKIDPVFKKILERNKLISSQQQTPRICIDDSAIQQKTDQRFLCDIDSSATPVDISPGTESDVLPAGADLSFTDHKFGNCKTYASSDARFSSQSSTENSLIPTNAVNSDLMFHSVDKLFKISPETSVLKSPKKSILLRVTSPGRSSIVEGSVKGKTGIRDGSCSLAACINLRNSYSSSSASKNLSQHVKLVSAPVVFPSAEKLLSPIPLETRNSTQSARFRKKLSPKNGCLSGKGKHSSQPQILELDEGRFCSKEEDRSEAQTFSQKKLSRGYWNRHGMLPPISSKENLRQRMMSTLSAATQRSSSASVNLGKSDVETRPNTSLPNKVRGITLLPLNEGNKKKSRIELAQEWLEKQLAPNSFNNSRQHRIHTPADTASRWRSHHYSSRK